MSSKNKKLEILYINDILSLNNTILSTKTNHYMKLFLFNLRVLFRSNKDDLDDLIEIYYYIEDILKNDITVDDEELKILIYRMTDLSVNLDEYNLLGQTIITETLANLIQSLLLELETYTLVDLYNNNDIFKNYLKNQIKDQTVEFNELIDILNNTKDEYVIQKVKKILDNNYQFEYARYKARCESLEY